MRDTIQNKEYFDKGIAFKQKTIDRDKNAVNEIPSHSGRAMELFSFRDTDVLDFMNIPFSELAVDWS